MGQPRLRKLDGPGNGRMTKPQSQASVHKVTMA